MSISPKTKTRESAINGPRFAAFFIYFALKVSWLYSSDGRATVRLNSLISLIFTSNFNEELTQGELEQETREQQKQKGSGQKPQLSAICRGI